MSNKVEAGTGMGKEKIRCNLKIEIIRILYNRKTTI
jgi:hypothetical protein